MLLLTLKVVVRRLFHLFFLTLKTILNYCSNYKTHQSVQCIYKTLSTLCHLLVEVTMVTHTRLQQYKHHYGMVCLTGMFGCRWHRYQQSTDDTKKVDLFWFLLLVIAASFVLLWFYFWIIAQNSYDEINWYIFKHAGSWVPGYTIALVLTCVVFGYVSLLMVLALCHIGHGHQIYLHGLHKTVVAITLGGCVAAAILITQIWADGWFLQRNSVMMTAPFLHLGGVILCTFLWWFVVAQTLQLHSRVIQCLLLLLYLGLLITIYIAPLYITSPCIAEADELPRKPNILAHRGAAAIAPENTVASFTLASSLRGAGGVVALESDVSVSFDGDPFLLHDTTLRRTTNVDVVFPGQRREPAAAFNSSQLAQLDAGSWFLQTDPHGTVKSLTADQKAEYRNQTIPKLKDLATLAKEVGLAIMFDIKMADDVRGGLLPDHPYRDNYTETIVKALQDAGIPNKQVWWLVDFDRPDFQPQFTTVLGVKQPGMPSIEDIVRTVRENNVSLVNTNIRAADWPTVRSLQQQNISVNVYTVNSPWLHSLYWCMGAASVTTNYAHAMATVTAPVWHMTPSQFRIMWIVADCVSVVIVVFVCIIQGLCTVRPYQSLKRSCHYKSDSAAMTLPKMSGGSRRTRTMKVQLINAAEGVAAEGDGAGAGNGIEDEGAVVHVDGGYEDYGAGDSRRPTSGDSGAAVGGAIRLTEITLQ